MPRDDKVLLPPFALRMKALREAAGLTQAQLAEQSGLHVGAIFKLEQGRREPAWATVQALAKALGVSLEAFADQHSAASTEPAPRPRGRPKKQPPVEQPAPQ